MDIDVEPLEYEWRPTAMVAIPAEMVVAMAQGLEPADQVAARFGFTPERWQQLSNYKPFELAVAAKKAELEKEGWVFRTKSAIQADMLRDQVFVQAMSNDVGLMQKLETLKFLAKVGGLEPKEEKQQNTGPAFQISINLGEQSVSLSSAHNTPTTPIFALPVTPDRPPKAADFDILEVPDGDFE